MMNKKTLSIKLRRPKIHGPLEKDLKFLSLKKKRLSTRTLSNPWVCPGLIYLFLIFLRLSSILNALKKK
jgi:hypothetical protein